MKINLMLAYNFCSLGLIFVLKKNNFFFHFNRTAEPDQSILISEQTDFINLIPNSFSSIRTISAPASTQNDTSRTVI